jgi:pyruvate ferredoxin oxidoreductase beta subunit
MSELQYEKISAKNLPQEEPFAPGHRACQGCGEVLALRMVMKAVGHQAIAVSATGCMEVCTSTFPTSSWRTPWFHVAFENAAAVASGVDSGYKALRRKGKTSQGRFPILAIAGDGGTADIGMQALSGALERWQDFIYVCLDNEAYMNTGIQRSSSTPFGAMTTTSPPGKLSKGQATWKKNMPAIAAAHGVPYVATASPAYYLDLMNKVRKAAATEGPAYLHIYAPCPTGWRMKPELAIESARLAVQSRVFPLYEVINGQYILNRKVDKPKPLTEYLKPQGRFRHLDAQTLADIEARVNAEYEKIVRLAGADKKPAKAEDKPAE